MRRINRITALLLALCLVTVSLIGCGARTDSADTDPADTENIGTDTSDTQYSIGVVVYDPESAEMGMFMNYYRSYIAQGFPVKFYFSNAIGSAEDENAFIRSMKEQGASGIISFYGQDVRSTVKVCEEEEIYYILGSGTQSDEVFEAVGDNPWFLGTVGPAPDTEYQAGSDMALYFSEQGCKSYLIMTGGSPLDNFMHYSRSQGMLEYLQETYDLELGDIEKLLTATEVTAVDTGSDEISITLSPGYMTSNEGKTNLETAMEAGDYDAVLSSYYLTGIIDRVDEKEEAQDHDIMVGAVDCFCEEYNLLFKEKDSFGNPRMNYLKGKYASMVGPAFAILYNAMSGHPEANSDDGNAVRLYQGFWTASSREEFEELYSYTQGIYANAYSCEDLSDVIKVYNPDTTPEDLKQLTEAYTVEDVENRIN